MSAMGDDDQAQALHRIRELQRDRANRMQEKMEKDLRSVRLARGDCALALGRRCTHPPLRRAEEMKRWIEDQEERRKRDMEQLMEERKRRLQERHEQLQAGGRRRLAVKRGDAHLLPLSPVSRRSEGNERSSGGMPRRARACRGRATTPTGGSPGISRSEARLLRSSGGGRL